MRLLWAASQAPDATILTGADLAAQLTAQGESISQQTVVAFLHALAAQHYLRLVLVFETELEVIVAAVAPTLADLLESPLDAES